MSKAIARVEQRITITGADNASDAIKSAQASMRGLEKQTGKSSKAIRDYGKKSKDAFKAGRDLGGDADTALKGIADFAGSGSQAVSELGDSLGAVEGVMRLIPGAAGLATAAVIGIALGGKLLYDHISRAHAALRLLGNEGTKGLAKDLNLSGDGAIKLTQAFDELKHKGLRPSIELLKQAKDNAEALGKDGEAATVKLVQAFEAGPEALKKWESEFGRLGTAILALPDLAKKLGLDAVALGWAQKVTLQGHLQVAAREEANLETRIQMDLDKALGNQAAANAKDAAAAAAQATLQKRQAGKQSLSIFEIQANARAAAAKSLTAAAKATSDELVRSHQFDKDASVARLKRLNKQAKVIQAAHTAQAAFDAGRSTAAAKANLIGDESLRLAAQKVVAADNLHAASFAVLLFDTIHFGNLTAEAALERELLKLKELQGKAAAKAIDDAAKARKKARRVAAAQRARAAVDAANTAKLKIATALADRDGIRTAKERLDLLDKAQVKELAATASVKGEKARALARLAIDEDYKTKRAKTVRDMAKDEEKAAKTSYERLKKRAAARVGVAKRADAAVAKAQRATAADHIAALRAAGAAEAAENANLAQARVVYAAEINAIDAELAAGKLKHSGDAVIAIDLEREAEAKRVAAKLALARVEAKIGDQKIARQKEQLDNALSSLAQTSRSLEALGQSSGNTGLANIAKGLGAATQGLKDYTAANGDAVKSTAAVADAVGGVTAIAIDADTKRTTNALEQEKQRKLAAATSESERAAITAEFEKKKADAVDAAEKRKALIMGAMEVAKAAASYPNIPEMAAHGVAAGLFFGVAGGAFGSAGGAGVAPGGGAGGFNSPSAGGNSGGQAAAPVGQNVTINFNQPLTTKQHIGKAVHGALRSLKTTGMASSKGV